MPQIKNRYLQTLSYPGLVVSLSLVSGRDIQDVAILLLPIKFKRHCQLSSGSTHIKVTYTRGLKPVNTHVSISPSHVWMHTHTFTRLSIWTYMES